MSTANDGLADTRERDAEQDERIGDLEGNVGETVDWIATAHDCSKHGLVLVNGSCARPPTLVSFTSTPCDEDHRGLVQYNARRRELELCDGSTWGMVEKPPIGSERDNPARTCMEIVNAREWQGDGLYWIGWVPQIAQRKFCAMKDGVANSLSFEAQLIKYAKEDGQDYDRNWNTRLSYTSGSFSKKLGDTVVKVTWTDSFRYVVSHHSLALPTHVTLS